ncbi:MAG TPA: right-handed parallel beta-helix repeat-containing protein [Armatimonadota bacterium]|nr:right-handed parallel beta-helix repeat-containing protein [Armatimonadota bacterium]
MPRWVMPALVMTVLHISGVDARVVHVAPGGDDAAAGTEAAPWATLTRAASSLAAGDTLVVHAGAYHGPMVIEASGTEAEPVVVQVEEGAEAVLEAPPGLGDASVGVLIRGKHVQLRGLTVRGFVGAGVQVGALVEPSAWDADHMRTDAYPERPADAADRVAVSGVTVRDCGTGIVLGQSTHCSVRDCVVTGSGGPGLWLRALADHNTLIGNQMSGNQGSGLCVDGGSSFNVIAENECSDNAGPGLLVTESCWRNVLGRNIAHGNGGPGLQCRGSRGSAWVWNVVYRNRGAGLAIGEPNGRGSRNTSVVGNVFEANAGGGICVFAAANVAIHQNIATANAHCQLFVSDWAIETGLHSIDRNCLHAPEGPAIAWGGLPEDWQPPAATVEATGLPALTGVASDNIGADPKFVAPLPECTLAEGSPCLPEEEGQERIGPNMVTPLPDDIPSPPPDDLPAATRSGTEVLRACLACSDPWVVERALTVARRAATSPSAYVDLEALVPDLQAVAAGPGVSPQTQWGALIVRMAAADALAHPEVEAMAAGAGAWELVRAADAWLAGGDMVALEALRPRAEEFDPWFQASLAARLAEADGEGAADSLSMLLESGSLLSRVIVASALARLHDPAGAEALRAELARASGPAVVMVLQGIRESRDSQLAADVAQALAATTDADALAAALETLGALADVSTVQAVATHAEDEEPMVRMAAIEALLRLGQPADVTAVRAALRDPQGSRRAAAARLAGELGEAEDVATVEELMSGDPNPIVRLGALEGLIRRAARE